MMSATPRLLSLLASLTVLAGVSVSVTQPSRAAEPLRLAQQDQMPGDDQGDDNGGGSRDPSALLLRVGRLENDLRTLRGRVEELQHQNDLLQDSLRKLSQDVDFRFQDLQHGGAAAPARPAPLQRRSDVGADPVATPTPNTAVAADPNVYVPLKSTKSGDAFDPDADPTAPGAPRPLGTTTPSQPLAPRNNLAAASDPRAPLDLMHTGNQGGDPGLSAPISTAGSSIIAAPPAARGLPNAGSVASLVPGGTRDEFDADVSLYKAGQFDVAATGLKGFVEKYPRDRLVPDAVYLAGELLSFGAASRSRRAVFEALDRLCQSTARTRCPASPRHVA